MNTKKKIDYRQPHTFEADGTVNDLGKPLCVCGLPQDIPSLHFPTPEKKKIECMEDCCVQRREFGFSNTVTPEPSGEWYSSLFDTDRDLYFRIKQLLFKEIEEMIKEKRKETWKFYHEAQLWEEQKQAVRPYDEMLKALKSLEERYLGIKEEQTQ